MDPKKASSKSVSKRVFLAIEQMLLSGKVKPGQFLPPERELAVLLQVGRPVVRESLKALEMIGVIEIAHGKGARVLAPSIDKVISPLMTSVILTQSNILNLIDVRLTIEPKCAYLSASQASAEEYQQFYNFILMMENALDQPSDFAAADYQFHKAIVQSTNNPILIQIYEMVAGLLWELQQRTAEIPNRKETLEVHKAIYEAIFNHHPDKAFKLLESHIEDTRKRFMHYQVTQISS